MLSLPSLPRGALVLVALVACAEDDPLARESEPRAPETARDAGAQLDGARDRARLESGVEGSRNPSEAGTRDGEPSASDAARDGRGSDAADARTASHASSRDGASYDGAAAAGSPDLVGSAGCGRSARGTGQFATSTLLVGERERTYHVRVPEDYRASRPYPLIFRFHGSGGDGLSGGLPIESESGNDALIVAPDGLNKLWLRATQAEDVALFEALLEEITSRYCVDRERIYAYGFSAGAMFSELLACTHGDVLRAIGAIAGWDETGGKSCTGQVAAWLTHDENDDAVPLARGIAARERLRMQSGCSEQSDSLADGCIRYRDCAAGQPLVWCQTSGLKHDIRGGYAPAEVWRFFSQLE